MEAVLVVIVLACLLAFLFRAAMAILIFFAQLGFATFIILILGAVAFLASLD